MVLSFSLCFGDVPDGEDFNRKDAQDGKEFGRSFCRSITTRGGNQGIEYDKGDGILLNSPYQAMAQLCKRFDTTLILHLRVSQFRVSGLDSL